MNTIHPLMPRRWTPPAPGPARLGAWLRRWFTPRQRAVEPAAATFSADGLADLGAHLLADIGAPEPLVARAIARHEARLQERDHLRLGIASGAWHHW